MRIPRIYTADTLSHNITYELDANASGHISRVLRMKVGDSLILFDGSGPEYPASITTITKKSVKVVLQKQRHKDVESPIAAHLGIAMSRGDRMDWLIQKVGDFDISVFAPIFSDRVEIRLTEERANKKLRHWQHVAISACEQCGRNTLPKIHAPQALDKWLTNTGADMKLVLHHRAERADIGIERPQSIALLVGPEGGLSEDEIKRAKNHGYLAVKLGPRVLRTETAPLAALAILQSQWGDMPI